MTGYFRDDAPLYALMLDERQQRQLDRLWEEFHFITLDPMRQYKDFIFFERAEPPRFMRGAEFDFARSEDKTSTSPKRRSNNSPKLIWPKHAETAADSPAIDAIEDYFKTISADIRRVEQAQRGAEPKHLGGAPNLCRARLPSAFIARLSAMIFSSSIGRFAKKKGWVTKMPCATRSRAS